MNEKQQAISLGRYCQGHHRPFEHVDLPNGVCITGCRECVTTPHFSAALDALIASSFSLARRYKRQEDK